MLTANLHNRILSPAEAEIWITIVGAELPNKAEVRGQLVGPHSFYASTVEVAYPFRPLPALFADRGWLKARVIIPEPSFWDPETPLLYHGSVELWEAGSLCWTTPINYGLRVLQLEKSGPRWNGRPFTIRGVSRQRLTVGDAHQLRAEGYNTLVSEVSPETADLWDAGDRFGFLVLGRLATHAACDLAESLQYHACCLGWLLSLEDMRLQNLVVGRVPSTGLLGLKLDQHPPRWSLLGGPRLFFEQDDTDIHRSVLLRSPSISSLGELKAPDSSRNIVGWITK